MKKFIKKIIGDASSSHFKKSQNIMNTVIHLEEVYSKMTDEELRGMTDALKGRLASGETLDAILPDAFAVVREASERTLWIKPYPVQVLGAIALHNGDIAEMKTGEGKTLVSTMAAYLNALTGDGVHVVTVNDYLAKRDCEWMGKIYTFLGLKVGLLLPFMDEELRHEAYLSDITYGTNSQFGFDYLKDNMVISPKDIVQRGRNFAIIDEADSILIDEARTPLIISGMGDKPTDSYHAADRFVKSLTGLKIKENENRKTYIEYNSDYVVEEKGKSVSLTEKGTRKAEKEFQIKNLADIENLNLSHHINQALRANTLMDRDVDYIVSDSGEIIIIDQFTGRQMYGRRYSNGLHQAIEAKEGVEIKKETQTLATITIQNYFRTYNKLAGMTGTAKTEEKEFQEIYNLRVIEIPTNKPMLRQDFPDAIYKTEKAKLQAIVEEVKGCHEKGQPVLVGTVSIEKSEKLSRLLQAEKIPHNILNAKNHEKEAEIVAQAGRRGAVTISTNMAGRGTDILLGGNPSFLLKQEVYSTFPEEKADRLLAKDLDAGFLTAEDVSTFLNLKKEIEAKVKEDAEYVKSVGGLFVLGSERHESRRIDNQLRGRAGRQGDPGCSRFFLSLSDDLLRLFGGDKMYALVDSMGLDESSPISSSVISTTVERAQKALEGKNFAIRKHVLLYDNVLNEQRNIIYKERNKVLLGEDLSQSIEGMMQDYIDAALPLYLNGQYPEEWDLTGLALHFKDTFLSGNEFASMSQEEIMSLTPEKVREILYDTLHLLYKSKEGSVSPPIMRSVERFILLRVIDSYWVDHIDLMSHFKNEVGLMAYGQIDPLTEYKKEGYNMFTEMLGLIKHDFISHLCKYEASGTFTVNIS